MTQAKGRLVVVSNRLPIVLTRVDKQWKIKPGSGGLITGLLPILQERGGVWIGWPGVTEDRLSAGFNQALNDVGNAAGYRLFPVILTRDEYKKFYLGFSNEVIWPLFHDLQSLCNFEPEYWRSYQRVNEKFADAIAEVCGPNDYIWVHDYHLITVSQFLRERGVESPIAFYLHTPFPPLDIFLKLPWRSQVLRGLLDFSLIGFQTLRDRRNFLQCVRRLVPDARSEGDGEVSAIVSGSRTIRVGVFPISIDFEDFEQNAVAPDVDTEVAHIRQNLPDRQLILGVDRLDYTKGIPYRFRAFRNALERFPELTGAVSFIQVVVPSRETIPQYRELKTEIDRLVGSINGKFTRSGWVPVHYIFRNLKQEELLAYYRACEIACITPLKDGMNLVAKEYCAATVDENGVLILSEFAGAAAQMQDAALLVNPYDIEGVANAIRDAFHMPLDERHARMNKLREGVRSYDIYRWLRQILEAAYSPELPTTPAQPDYLPQIDVE